MMFNVVVFEDNPLVLKSIVSTINWKELGCSIAGAAENGNDAYKLLHEIKIDIVISDIKMPGMDGLELAKKISEMDLHVKIILITGYHEFELARRAVSLGVFDMLTKPLSNESICSSVNKAIEALNKESKNIESIDSIRAPDSASSLVRHTFAYLNQNFVKDITLEMVADEFMVSTNHLSRVLKKETGNGFVEILTKIRMKEALKLLENPDSKVYMVAEQVGYKDYSYFFQVFKKFYNVSPQKYRNKFL
ncbi:MAG: response regulator [Treponema sp.]|nr:response regulator [Treponema sp.]